MYKRTRVTREEIGSLTFAELSDIDVSHAIGKRIHTLVCAIRKWILFAEDPVREGWLVDIRI